jgi:glycosyltransferase involved in cell wall biosynthesis
MTTQRAPRIALYGNLCNNLYQIAKAVRERVGLDVHLFVDVDADSQQMPESDDPELRGGYPDWIHKGVYSSFWHKAFPWRSPLVRELSAFDAVVVSGIGPMFAPFVRAPIAFFVTGGDLTVAPFPRDFLFLYPTLRLKLVALYAALWQRMGIRKASVWSPSWTPFREALEKLGVADAEVTARLLPILLDTDKFSARVPRAGGIAAELRERFDFILFHPSRMMINDQPGLKATGQWKQNDLLFKAFTQFIKKSGARKAGLVMIDRAASPDNDAAKRIIGELGIESSVVWIKPLQGIGFSREELIELYSVADVVADDFGVGWFGSVVVEALAVGKPVMCYVDAKAMNDAYPWHPLLSDDTVDGNAAFLERLHSDEAFRAERGRMGRQWALQFNSYDAAAAVYADHMRRLADCATIAETVGETGNAVI